tara:strand:+ start:216 stop:725 length:510 start_codon:yes stop_codon:yes gene_type:complete
MALVLSRSRGINLADTFAFTGTVSGDTGGTVKKIVTQTYNDFSSTSTSYTEIVTLAITKTSASNPLLIQLFSDDYIDSNSTSNWAGMGWAVYNNSGTQLFTSGYKGGIGWGTNLSLGGSCAWVDTTSQSSVTYSFRAKMLGAMDNFGSTRLHIGENGPSNLVMITEFST